MIADTHNGANSVTKNAPRRKVRLCSNSGRAACDEIASGRDHPSKKIADPQ
jgi:hypothetical protein